MPKSRSTSGFADLPGGPAAYRYAVQAATTTTKTPEEIYQTGLSEVKRLRTEMEAVKKQVGFQGDLPAFFAYMKNEPKFRPYKTPQEVLDGFEAIHQRMLPNLKNMFGRTPKTPFEVRQTEAYRAASASAQYSRGSADGTRAGIFYVPILDATQYNITSLPPMEDVFLHEAIPGHHYQISLQQENTALPKFRRFGGYSAFSEGWGLYCESLGKELGLYTDPYQYAGSLGGEMHRAIRLVVDVGLHAKGMTREEAIKYMLDNEVISEQLATAEIERYMGNPGQALSYKVGQAQAPGNARPLRKAVGLQVQPARFPRRAIGWRRHAAGGAGAQDGRLGCPPEVGENLAQPLTLERHAWLRRPWVGSWPA
ncbi:DUF885 domain-containing protein [Hymenobacter humi]